MKEQKEDNEFNKFVDKIVDVENIHWFDHKDIKWKVPLPNNNDEFKAFTKKYYGVELNVSVVVMSKGIRYEVKEKEQEYSRGSLMKSWDNKFGCYDGLKVLLIGLFGESGCGGVAGSHYGDTTLSTSKCKKFLTWDNIDNQTKLVEEHIKQENSLREIFGC